MKKTFKFTIIILFACVGFYNINLIKHINSDTSIELIKSEAMADDEDEGSAYKTQLEATGTTVVTTTKSDGTTCSTIYEYHNITCSGQGNLNCEPSSETTLCSSTC